MNHTDIPASAAPTVFDANAPTNNTAYEPRTPNSENAIVGVTDTIK